MGKVFDGEIRHGGGEHYLRLSQMLQYGWIFSMGMITLLTKQDSDLGFSRPWQHGWIGLG